MDNVDVTASAVISFAEKLEDSTSAFYDGLADRFADQSDTFVSFAKDSRKSKKLIVRTYQETITDALEACFGFEGLRLADHVVDTTLAQCEAYPEAVRKAVELETTAIAFYTDVAERSASLLATIPGAFKRAAKTRNKRKRELQALVES